MRVRKVRVVDCPSELYKKFYYLNFGRIGGMRNVLVNLRSDQSNRAVIHYIESDEKVLAWTLSFPNDHIKRYNSYFYVRKNNRRQGLGTKLFCSVEKFFVSNNLRFKVHPHNHESSRFFIKCTKGKCIDKSNSLIHMKSYFDSGWHEEV